MRGREADNIYRKPSREAILIKIIAGWPASVGLAHRPEIMGLAASSSEDLGNEEIFKKQRKIANFDVFYEIDDFTQNRWKMVIFLQSDFSN